MNNLAFKWLMASDLLNMVCYSSYFYCTPRIWNTFHFAIRDAGSMHTFRKNLNELYLTMINSFDVNNH